MKKYFLLLALFCISVTLIRCMPPVQENPYADRLYRSTPESQGVESAGILKFIESIEKENLEVHSFMLLRHGTVIAEGWWNPYRPDLRHFMFSTSKAFVTTAMGFAVAENLVSVNDKVTSFFPEYKDAYAGNDFVNGLTIKNLLTMTAGEEAFADFRQREPDWIRSFFEAEQKPENAGKFIYNTYATYMMSAIIQRVSGNTVLDYLKPRLFEPLSISGMTSELSPAGINCGGWGMSATTSDLAKLGQLYLQKGMWNGVQLLPADWIEEAGKLQVETNNGGMSSTSDWAQGYGYQLWRCRNNAYRADGAFGQFIIVMPDQDAVLAITAHVNDSQKELDLVWNWILPAMHEKPLGEDRESNRALSEKLKSLALPKPVDVLARGDFKNISGIYTLADNELNIKSLSLKQQGDSCRLIIRTDNGTYNFIAGNDNWAYGKTERNSPHFNDTIRNSIGLSPFTVAAYYGWKANNTLLLKLLYMEDGSSETFTMTFGEKNADISVINCVEGYNSPPIQLSGHLN